MKEIEVFIAGSKTLSQLRDSARAVFSEISNQYRDCNILIRPYTFEDFPRSFSNLGRQEDYNHYISNKADYTIFIFDEGFGEITLEELNLAICTFLEKKRPQIYVYCNEAKMNSDEYKEIRDHINSFDQYYISYEEGHFKEQLYKDFNRLISNTYYRNEINIFQEKYSALKENNNVGSNEKLNWIKEAKLQINYLLDKIANEAALSCKSDEFIVKSDLSFFIELAESLNDLYVKSTLVFINFPKMDNSQILERMKKPCEGAYKEMVQKFASSIHQLALVLNNIFQNLDTFEVYKQRLLEIDSKVLHLYPDRKLFDMNKPIDVLSLLDDAQKSMKEPMMDRLIRARLATNIGKGKEYDNANIRLFFNTGNIIFNIVEPNYVNNLGAAILHDLYMILPDGCKQLVTSPISSALSDAEEIGDLYHITLGK